MSEPERGHWIWDEQHERARGLVHTPLWAARMAELQRRFDDRGAS